MQTEKVCSHSQTFLLTNGVLIWPHATLPLAFCYRKISFFGAHCYASTIIGLPSKLMRQNDLLTLALFLFTQAIPPLMRASRNAYG